MPSDALLSATRVLNLGFWNACGRLCDSNVMLSNSGPERGIKWGEKISHEHVMVDKDHARDAGRRAKHRGHTTVSLVPTIGSSVPHSTQNDGSFEASCALMLEIANFTRAPSRNEMVL